MYKANRALVHLYFNDVYPANLLPLGRSESLINGTCHAVIMVRQAGNLSASRVDLRGLIKANV